ncbi:MAG: hypothetical protein H6739_16235 [Alphaproteobacteria bacterium]|nr:hypothetical protein [Alphaproteobacteria bacterium]
MHGVELMVRHAPVDRLFGWVSYTLSRSERCDAVDSAACDRSLGFNDADSDWYLFDFDQTHIFTTVAGYTLPYEIEVSGRFQYVTGNPYTPQDQGVYDIDQDFYQGFASGDRNAQRLPDYKALDLRIDKAFTFNKWRLETYLDLLNVYRGVNPEFINYNYDYTESAYIRGLPFIPRPASRSRCSCDPAAAQRLPHAVLNPSWYLDRTRILAVAAEPAEPAPGDTVTFQLPHLRPGPGPYVLWAGCVLEESDAFGCTEDEAGILGWSPSSPHPHRARGPARRPERGGAARGPELILTLSALAEDVDLSDPESISEDDILGSPTSACP